MVGFPRLRFLRSPSEPDMHVATILCCRQHRMVEISLFGSGEGLG